MNVNNSALDGLPLDPEYEIPKFYTFFLYLIIMLMHLMYMIFFFRKRVYFMGCVNIFSVSFYSYGIYYSLKGKDANLFMQLSLLEIVIHAILATLFTDWRYGFQMFLICMIPVPYMFSLRKTPLTHIVSVSIMALFVSLRILCVDVGVNITSALDAPQSSMWYIFNSIMSFIVILLVTLSFRIKMRYLNYNLAQQNEMLQQAASLDSLTGLFNRRAMNSFFGQIQSSGQKYCVVISDVDFFKRVNDTYGHSTGDKVLAEFAQMMLSEVPTEGYVCRWGGEEFLFLIPNTDLKTGAQIADKLRKDVSDISFTADDGRDFRITVTFGVCEGDPGQAPDRAVNIADSRLYIGKECGRNCVICSNQKYN